MGRLRVPARGGDRGRPRLGASLGGSARRRAPPDRGGVPSVGFIDNRGPAGHSFIRMDGDPTKSAGHGVAEAGTLREPPGPGPVT